MSVGDGSSSARPGQVDSCSSTGDHQPLANVASVRLRQCCQMYVVGPMVTHTQLTCLLLMPVNHCLHAYMCAAPHAQATTWVCCTRAVALTPTAATHASWEGMQASATTPPLSPGQLGLQPLWPVEICQAAHRCQRVSPAYPCVLDWSTWMDVCTTLKACMLNLHHPVIDAVVMVVGPLPSITMGCLSISSP
jgi:hypothetical protein